MIVVVDLGVADLVGAVEELGDEQVLALRRQLDDAVRLAPSGCRRRAAGAARSPRTGPAGAPTGTGARPPGGRTGSCGRACTSGRRARGSSRRAWRTGRCRRSPATRSRSGVEPPEPASPTGLMSSDGHAELILDRVPDRVAPAAADVEVGGLAAVGTRPGRPRSG